MKGQNLETQSKQSLLLEVDENFLDFSNPSRNLTGRCGPFITYQGQSRGVYHLVRIYGGEELIFKTFRIQYVRFLSHQTERYFFGQISHKQRIELWLFYQVTRLLWKFMRRVLIHIELWQRCCSREDRKSVV